MVLKLYGSDYSTCAKTVAVVLREKEVPFEYHDVDMLTGANKTEAYREKQPFGQIPYIDDDGFILYESRAIARYIQEKYPEKGPQLIPTDLKKRALFEQAVSIETCQFDPSASAAVIEVLVAPYHGRTPDPIVFQGHIKTLSAKLDVYDKILSKQKYLAGDELTLADLFHLPYGSLLAAAGSDVMLTKPNVARWFGELVNRPSWQAVKDTLKPAA